MSLKAIRRKIDAVDRAIVKLLDQRVGLVGEVGRLKKQDGTSWFVPSREAEVLRAVTAVRKRFPADALETVFRTVFQACRSLEESLRIACLGPAGTYSHEAALRLFGTGVSYKTLGSIADIFDAVEEGAAHYGVVPFENTTEGIVTHTVDLFWSSDLRVINELYLPVSNCVLSRESSLSRIRRVYSHPQPLAQARKWLAANLPSAKLIETGSTAEAARMVKGMKNAAAVASEAASRIYRLNVLARDIQDLEVNVTRFLVLSRTNANRPTGKDKTSVVFTVKDKPGALFSILSCFKEEGVNMSKIESRPFRGRPWEYFFFVDLTGHEADAAIRRAVVKVRAKTIDFKILGSYPCESEGRTG
jgi:chorismate mutase/prephenate dehydratase